MAERESNELLLLIRKSRVLELWRYSLYGEGEFLVEVSAAADENNLRAHTLGERTVAFGTTETLSIYECCIEEEIFRK